MRKNIVGSMRFGIFTVLLLAALPQAALADVPMFPFIFFGLPTMLAIPAAVAIEAVALSLLFGLHWHRALVVSFGVNLMTLILGMFFYIFVAGMLPYNWESLYVWDVLYPMVSSIVLPLTHDLAIIKLAVIVIIDFGIAIFDTFVELFILRWYYKQKLNLRRIIGFLIANIITIGLLDAAMAWEMAR